MDTTWNSALARIVEWFPNEDAHVIGVLLDHRDAVVRYLAQVHEITVSEVSEVLDVLLGFREDPVALAAE